MANIPFVSIVVPIYNVEPYIDQCISSVLRQSYDGFELILVDDGSPDNCPVICEEYARSDARIKVVHKENGGLSDARNMGVKEAAGEYVLFLDSDDFWDDENALKKLFTRSELTHAEIINFSFKKYFEDTRRAVPYLDALDMKPDSSLREQIQYLLSNGLLIASACNKLIKRSLLHDLEFEKGVYSEDIIWTMDVTARASAVDYINESFYCYRQRERSITHVPNNKRCEDLAKAICDCLNRIDNAPEEFKELFRVYTAFQFGTFMLVQAQAQEYQRDWLNRLSRYKHILKYHRNNKKLMFLRLGCVLLGYKGMCKVIRAIYKLIYR